MTLKIGFKINETEKNETRRTNAPSVQVKARPSLVEVCFPGRSTALTYYNDTFDLRKGDLVYVDGKLEGRLGKVTAVCHSFRIKLSDYKRVIALVDTEVNGDFVTSDNYFLTFDREALPSKKAALWFRPPHKEEVVAVGKSEKRFPLDNLKKMRLSATEAERGYEYYLQSDVLYLSLDGRSGYAVVAGSRAHEIEFEYENGEISNVTCDCFSTGFCRHTFAAMLQLKETVEMIEEEYSEELDESGYFSLVNKATLFNLAIKNKKKMRLLP